MNKSMKMAKWEESGVGSAYSAIRKLGLETHVADLDTYGFTVIPPQSSGALPLLDRLIDKIMEISAQRNNEVVPDIKTGSTHSELANPAGQHLFYLLGEDPVFQEAMMNPVLLAFVRYLLPEAVISSCTSMLKGPGQMPLPLHSDQPIHPIPNALVCNTTYLLSDYDRANGALCFVPGSHKLMRQPTLGENFGYGKQTQAEVMLKLKTGKPLGKLEVTEPAGVVAVEAKKGSLVVWHGNTWHGAFNRTESGLRMNFILYWCSSHLRPQEAYRELLSEEVIERNGDEFAALIGKNVHHGWTSEGPEYVPGVAFKRHRSRANANTEAL